jgi:hypothetical protein
MEDQPLLIVRDKKTGNIWECSVEGDALVIGREDDCGLPLNDRQVSRHHATICRQGGHYVLRDLGSRNGTFLNSELLMSVRQLQDGDEIGLASRYRITFVASEATAPLYRDGPQRRGISLDRTTRHVWVDGVRLAPPLSSPQFRLLEFLVTRDGDVCTRDQVIEAVYVQESAEGVTDQALDAIVRRLRERLAEAGSEHNYIETVRGTGFRLRKPE